MEDPNAKSDPMHRDGSAEHKLHEVVSKPRDALHRDDSWDERAEKIPPDSPQTHYGQSSQQNASEGSIEVLCGPLLNYRRTENADGPEPEWHGSVLLVLGPKSSKPSKLGLSRKGSENGHSETQQSAGSSTFEPVLLYSDPAKQFWRYEICVKLGPSETTWSYHFAGEALDTISRERKFSFTVPAASQSFRIMFHSCNGFSIGTDMQLFHGPEANLWKDVLRIHEEKPFHVMIGGGDQIYNDNIRTEGPLKTWANMGNPKKRRDHHFDEKLRAECDAFYFENYRKWFSMAPFSLANCQIPQINVWDDHDIIDGFGSYTNHFMKCAVFRGIGGVAFKYYCLFQHHVPPPRSSFTTDAAQTAKGQDIDGPGIDPRQLENTYILSSHKQDPSYIIGHKPGPYVEERSRSLYCRLGSRIAFFGLDARTERTRHQVNYPETYDLIFNRLRNELSSSKQIKHLIVLLGIPIAYPRLNWLENIFQSPIIGPIRFLSKRFGFAGGLFNEFDGNVDLLDDLDDHYTAGAHKKERRELMLRLQSLSKEFSVRITILGGDVHLAALGRFYSRPKLQIQPEHDFRYMANIISSAITNKPPPALVANLLARRNKVHHLDRDTDETLMKMFDKDPGGRSDVSASYNHVTMPSRNFAVITENASTGSASATNGTNGTGNANGNGFTDMNGEHTNGKTHEKVPGFHLHGTDLNAGHRPLHRGEADAGTTSAVADGFSEGCFPGGLDVAIRVEIDSSKDGAETTGYGFSIPTLELSGKA